MREGMETLPGLPYRRIAFCPWWPQRRSWPAATNQTRRRPKAAGRRAAVVSVGLQELVDRPSRRRADQVARRPPKAAVEFHLRVGIRRGGTGLVARRPPKAAVEF